MVHVRSEDGAAAQNARRAERRKLHLRNMRNLLHSYRQGHASLLQQRNRAEEELRESHASLLQQRNLAEAQASAATQRTTETLSANRRLIAAMTTNRTERHQLEEELARATEQLSALQQQLRDRDAEIEAQLREQAAHQQQQSERMAALREEYTELYANSQLQRADYDNLRGVQADLVAACDALTAEAANLREENDMLRFALAAAPT